MEGYSPSPVPNSRRITVEEGNDYFLGPNDELPFKLLRNLGHGKSGFVSEVKDTWTGAVYACKTFPLDLPCDTHKRRRAFQNEMNILRRLAKHQHIVSVFATFSKECELSLLLLPVADQRDLSVFLRASLRDQTIDQRKISILRQAFGCLANGLAFIHRYRVRHKDIKPSNILVHRGSVLYTDFGFSLDSSKADQSTTTGRPEFWTRRYSAPEVLEYEDRNSGSDVFSLGCVYIEMLSVMNPQLRSAGKVCFGEEIEQVHTLMNASEAPTTFLADLAPLCISMTQRARSSRPNASQAFEIIQKLPGYVCSQCLPRESIKGETVPYTEKSTDMGATSRREELLNNTEHKKQHENFISKNRVRTDNGSTRYIGRYFRRGVVFSTLDPEPSMHPAPYQQRSDDVTPILYSCDSIPQVRLYVVVKVKDRSVYACAISPIPSPNELKAAKHSIVYLKDTQPVYMSGEPLTRDPIAVIPTLKGRFLPPYLWLRYGEVCTFEVTAKVEDFGLVDSQDMPKLIQYWLEENDV